MPCWTSTTTARPSRRRTAATSSAGSCAWTTPGHATPVAPGSGWRSCRRSSRRTTARSRRSRAQTAGAASRSGSLGTNDRVEPVAHAAHRLERLAVERSVDLPPEVADVDLDDVVGTGVVGVPDVLEDLALALHLACLAHQVVQQGVLTGGQLDLATLPGDPAGGGVQAQPTDGE